MENKNFKRDLEGVYETDGSRLFYWLRWQGKLLIYKLAIKYWFKDCHTILDVGCGNGKFIELARKYGKEAYGVDFNKENEKQYVEIMDFKDIKKQYDGVFNFMFLEHIDHFEFMEAMNRICKKRLITITYYPVKKFWESPVHTRPYLPITLKRLYKGYGFNPVFAARISKNSVMCIGDRIRK